MGGACPLSPTLGRRGCNDPRVEPLTGHNLFQTVDGLVALGTLLLAAGTLTLAWTTRATARRTRDLAEQTRSLASSTEREVQAVVDQAEAARQEVEVSREALQATYRPRLVDVPSGSYVRQARTSLSGMQTTFDDSHIVVSSRDERVPSDRLIIVPVRNVGTGLALIQEVRLRW